MREQLFLFKSDKLGIRETELPADKLFLFRHYNRYLAATIIAEQADGLEWALDVGCGSGYGAEILGLVFKRVIGEDADQRAIQYARQMHSKTDVAYVDGGHTRQYDIKFNMITCIEVIEHMSVDQAERMVESLARHLTPGGILYLTTPIAQKDVSDNPYHQHEYSIEEIERLLNKYFGVVHIDELSLGLPEIGAVCKEPRCLSKS